MHRIQYADKITYAKRENTNDEVSTKKVEAVVEIEVPGEERIYLKNEDELNK